MTEEMINRKFVESRRKGAFIELRRNRDARSSYEYTIDELRALSDMAKEDVWPDGEFSDMDCCVWSLLRELVRMEHREDEWG